MIEIPMSHLPIIIAPDYSSFARAIYILCDIRKIKIKKTDQHEGETVGFYSDKLASLNPWQKLPLMQHNGMLIGESVAIARYLNALKPDELNLFGVDLQSSANIEYWLQSIVVYVDQLIIRNTVLEFAFPKGENNNVRFDVVKQNQKSLRRCLHILNQQVSEQFVIEERLTICDIFLVPMLGYLASLPEQFNLISEYKNLQRYIAFHSAQNYFKTVFHQ